MNFILPFIGKNRRPQTSLTEDQELDQCESEEDSFINPDDTEETPEVDPEPSSKIPKHSMDDSSIDLFFQAMAATLKTLPKQTQAQVKAEVFQIISKAEIASFSIG